MKNKKAISFSVVIPLYNKRGTIIRAIRSVLAQLADNDEVVVVDDGSTDGSANVVLHNFRRVKELRLIRKENGGVSTARNEGVNAARHDYVIFLDADDWWIGGVRDKLKALVNRWPSASAWSVGHYRTDGEKRLRIESGTQDDQFLVGAAFVSHYAKYSGTINSSSSCINVGSFEHMGGFPVGATSGEDVFVWLRLGLEGGVAVSAEPLVCVERSLDGTYQTSNGDKVGYHYYFFF